NESTTHDTSGPLLADSGFRPAANGFGFQNYGNENGPINLTPNTMRALFGDAVCASTVGGCELIPQAEAWMAEQNTGMANGHCYGMSVTSLLLAGHELDPAKYGAESTVKLNLADNPALQEMIAQQFVGQWMPDVVAGQVKGTPKQVVDKLVEVLKPGAGETYSVGFYKRDMTGGHEVTPYAVEDKGKGQVSILIYDNNFPGVTSHIDVDRNTDTWHYQTASNPADPSEPYDGDASTATLMLDPTMPAQQKQTFPYLGHDTKGSKGNGPKAGGPALTVFLDGDPIDHGHLLITDDGGRRIGFVNGKRVNEIPGARFVDVKSNNSTYKFEPEYPIPAGTHFTVTVDGTGLKRPDKTGVVILGDAFDVSVSGITLAPGAKSTIDMGIDGDRVSYSSTDAQTPDIEIGESYEEADYAFAVSRAAVGAGGVVSVTLPLDRNVFSIDATGSKARAALGVTMERIDDHGKRTFKKDGIAVAANASAAFDFDSWDDGGKSITLTVTDQGKPTTTQLPAN
ncbi:hypothetical protein, partial [Nocardia seriolae]